ncbi:hypothetical protein MSAN_00778600 [Mycena sanguinolenta]|uniref:Uncharacterized protein n=1 Tax=Mycena sanguinolenta TaxID=230812 RepID=A0A8H6Z2H7_9AGAR|nr:hypothetical protein MSAN_00778600 [Mycena sanguinolenta]
MTLPAIAEQPDARVGAATPLLPPRKASSRATAPTASPLPRPTATTQLVTADTSLALVLPTPSPSRGLRPRKGTGSSTHTVRDSPRPLGQDGQGEEGGEAMRLVMGMGERAVLLGDHIVALSARTRRRARGRAPRTGSGPSPTTRNPPRRTYPSQRLANQDIRSATRGSYLTRATCDSSAPSRWKGQEGRAAGGEVMQRVEGAGGGETGQH